MFDIFILFTDKFQHDGYDPADSDGDVLIEKETLPVLGKFAVTLPVTFFDYSRNVTLLNRCKPFLIKLVDVNKHQWYYKKQIQMLAKNTIKSDTEVYRNESKFNIHREVLKPKIRPVDITSYADYNKVIKRNSSPQHIKHVKHGGKSCYLPRPLGFKKVEYVDFKKNVGLVGLKILPSVDTNVPNAKVARSKDKKEVQTTIATCGDSAKSQTTLSSDKQKPYCNIENKTDRTLKTDQDNLKLSSTNNILSDDNVSVKEASISLNNNETNKEFHEKAETAKDLLEINLFTNECIKSHTEKDDKIKKAEKNPMLKEMLTISTISPKSKILVGQHIKFDPGNLNTRGELDKKTKLSFGSQKISKKFTESLYLKDNKKKTKCMTHTVDKTKVPSEFKKDKKKTGSEKKDSVLKMVIPNKPKIALNVNQNFKSVHDITTLTGDQISKTPKITEDVTYHGKPHNTYSNIPTRQSLPNNDLLNNHNVLNYYQISSKNYQTNSSITSQVPQHNFRIHSAENIQSSSFCLDNADQLNNTGAPITKTNKPKSHVTSAAPSQISMHINSNNGKSAVLVQNIVTKDNHVVQNTALPQVTARHCNLPDIVQKKGSSQNPNVPNAGNALAAEKHMETKKSRSNLDSTDNTTNKRVSKELAPTVYGMFDGKGNVINRMNNQEIFVRRAVIQSNAMNNRESPKAANQGFTEVVSEKLKSPETVVVNQRSSTSPNHHSEISVKRAHEEKSRFAVGQVPTQVAQQRRNTSECVVINHQSNPTISQSEPREIIARRRSDTTHCVNVENNSVTSNKVRSKGYLNGPNNVPVMAALNAHLNENRVPFQASLGKYHGTNGNQKDILSFAQEKNNVQQRFPMMYTNNMANFESNMNMNQAFIGGNEGLNVNVQHNNNAMPMYQPMPQQHIDYRHQGQPIQTCIGNRPMQDQNRSTHLQRSTMNMTSVDLPYPHVMQNVVPTNNVHYAPIYNGLLQDMNLHNEGSYYNSNQSNALWPYLYPPPPPPPPVQTTGTFFPPTATVNVSPQSTSVPSSVANSSSIIGCNNSGIIRKINIVAVPSILKRNPSNISSGLTNPVHNLDDKPANSKLEMLEELTKVIMAIPPDSPVSENNIPIYPLTKPDFSVADFRNAPDQSINVNTQSKSIPTTHKLKEGVLSSAYVVRSGPDQNVATLVVNERNIPITQAESNVSSLKLNTLGSPIKNQSKQITVSPLKIVTEGSFTEASTRKHSTTLASSSSPKIQNFKRPHPTTEVQDKCPEMRKILSSNSIGRPGPLSKKSKLSSFRKPSSLNRDSRGKLVLPAVNTGYSPPILPILTYEETLEYIAQAHPETSNDVEKDDIPPIEEKFPVSILRNRISKNNCNKGNLFEEDKSTTPDKSVKKISLDEYKKRVGKNAEKDMNNITIKLECKTEKNDDMKQGSDLDLGYDSDSTLIL